MEENKQTVEMTAEEAAQFAAFKAKQEKEAQKAKAKEDRIMYSQIVDDAIDSAIPVLMEISDAIKTSKGSVLNDFETALKIKEDVLKITKDNQKSHTFTHSDGNKRITLGKCISDGWKDTVEDGIEIVRETVLGLIKDSETKALVNQILRLLSRDKAGNLKAAKVLQLRKLAEELNNDRLSEGITIIEESYIPTLSKTYVRAEYKDEKGAWHYIPLGMTEA